MSSIDSLLLNPRTKTAVISFLGHPSHGLMLVGPNGAGKRTVAEYLSGELLGFEITADIQKYPHFTHIERAEGKKDISIDTVRSVIRSSQLKIPGTKAIRRVILIENAQNLSLPAQNALLKILEEPSEDTVFVLTAPSAASVLPTIASRVFQLDVGPVSLESAEKYYARDYPSTKIGPAWRLSLGQAGLLHALLVNERQHPLKRAIEEAKKLIQRSSYELIVSLDQSAKEDDQFPLILDALGRVVAALHHAAIAKDNSEQARALLVKRKIIRQLQSAQNAKANQRLLSLELALNLGR